MIKKDMDINEYHKNKMVLSSTGLKKLKKSTRTFIDYLIRDQETKLHFDFGNAFEVYLVDQLTGSNKFDQEVAVMPTEAWKSQILNERPNIKNPGSTKEYQEWKAMFLEANFGKYIIPDVGETESFQALKEMAHGCMKDPVVKRMLEGSEYQQSFFWTDEETGLKLKTRPDLSKKKKQIIFDIKTTTDASPQGFARQVANMDYPLQAVMQIEGAINTGYFKECEGYFWLAVEKTPPYDWGLYELQKEDIEHFQDLYRFLIHRAVKAFELLAQMEADGFVPSYGETADNPYGILALEIPLWYRNY